MIEEMRGKAKKKKGEKEEKGEGIGSEVKERKGHLDLCS